MSESSGVHYRGPTATGASTTNTPVRSETPDSRIHNPFRDGYHDEDHITPSPNPFATPEVSRPGSSYGSSSNGQVGGGRGPPRYFQSRRVHKGDIDQPWRKNKDPKEKWVTIIPILGLLAGCGIAAFFIYDGLASVVHHKYCPIMSDDFRNGFDTSIWTKEAEVGGFGNGQFEETTTTDENVFVRDGKLIIMPTLQDAKLIDSNHIINLTRDGICSSDVEKNCVAQTNMTAGTIIPPVRSGRINTKKGATIKYGRVEVTAKLPAGDWLWPAIWMLPVNDTYGPWPTSGEIDIVEGRGNNHTYKQGGNNIVSSALHWGPDSANDAWWRTNVKRSALHTTYAAKEHKFGLEWSQKYLFTYIDTRLLQVLYTNFDQPLFQRGQFPLSTGNGTRLRDSWGQTNRPQTPFDQPFYLIMNVAVGGTNGWFQDGDHEKPWVDSSKDAARDFWDARDDWYPTWEEQGRMEITKVEMWQQCDGHEFDPEWKAPSA